MRTHPRRLDRRPLRRGLVGLVAVTIAGALVVPAGAASAANPATPGSFTGYGFDQCTAPSQSAMNAWLRSSPFWAVGIYISGDSRGCRSQPNLTATWVRTQLANGWRLLPITMGPQASCNPRFPRYGTDKRISSSSANTYAAARKQGRAEAGKTVSAAKALGIVPGSTLWYDLESYDIRITSCRESALWFLSAWTARLHALGYVSGVYSSAATGMKALDDARANRSGTFHLPDQIWVATWDGHANTSTGYLRSDGWMPHKRVKQYAGPQRFTYGGVTIDIDRDWVDLGRGSTAPAERDHCGGVRISFRTYPKLTPSSTGSRVTALQCLLTSRGTYSGPLDGTMNSATQSALVAYKNALGLSKQPTAGEHVWTSLHSQGRTKLIKYGAASHLVRRLQRSLNSAANERLPVTGVFASQTTAAVKRYQSRNGLRATGVVTDAMWTKLRKGIT